MAHRTINPRNATDLKTARCMKPDKIFGRQSYQNVSRETFLSD
jgi:hypothetical protein